MLTAKDSPDNYKEVTDAEKAEMEAADAEWEQPPQQFIDQWYAACNHDTYPVQHFGKYNEQTGYFELNGIKDIGYAEALRIWHQGSADSLNGISGKVFNERTNLPFNRVMTARMTASSFVATSAPVFAQEVVCLQFLQHPYYEFLMWPHSSYCSPFCSPVRKVLGTCYLGFATDYVINWFVKAVNLESVTLINLGASIDLRACGKLDYESFSTLVNRSNASKAITAKVHPDVWAKMTGDTTNEAAAALTAEELAKWTELPTLAAGKKITFTTG